MQSIFANAKLCSNISLPTVFHPAPQSSRGDFLIYPLSTKCWFGSVLLGNSFCSAISCYFLKFCVSAENGAPTQNPFLFVAVWGDSLDKWVLFAGEKGMKFSPFSGEALMPGCRQEQHWPRLTRSADAAKSHFLRLSAFLLTLPPFMPRHETWAGPCSPWQLVWHLTHVGGLISNLFWMLSWIKCFQSLQMTRQELNDCRENHLHFLFCALDRSVVGKFVPKPSAPASLAMQEQVISFPNMTGFWYQWEIGSSYMKTVDSSFLSSIFTVIVMILVLCPSSLPHITAFSLIQNQFVNSTQHHIFHCVWDCHEIFFSPISQPSF